MTQWQLSREMPPRWNAACVRHRSFFHAAGWLGLLAKVFRAQTLYAWNETQETGAAITVFRAGPFRVGYVGFPIGGTLAAKALQAGDINLLAEAAARHQVHVLRVPVGAFSASGVLRFPYVEVPETAILDLQAWQLAQHPKLLRDVNKANRSELRLIDVSTASAGDAIYWLYRATVARRGGELRYNAAYFRGLVRLTETHPTLRCRVAMSGEVVAGCIVALCDGDSAYYLHAATDATLPQYNAADVLLHDAIEWAQARGMVQFNLMASPAAQAGLLRYKEKWGAVTAAQKTYEIRLQPVAARLFHAAMIVRRAVMRR